MFRGYFPDLFACVVVGAVEPSGGGIDSVVVDGVTYYWLGVGCPGPGCAGLTSQVGNIIAVRAD
jgi:hypothetical protein